MRLSSFRRNELAGLLLILLVVCYSVFKVLAYEQEVALTEWIILAALLLTGLYFAVRGRSRGRRY